jgi:DNA-directed RNA polymerase subunit RPC12/RpoP
MKYLKIPLTNAEISMLARRLKEGQPLEILKLAEQNTHIDFINVVALNHKTALLAELMRQPAVSKPLLTYCCAYCKESFGPVEKNQVMSLSCPSCGGMVFGKAAVMSEIA